MNCGLSRLINNNLKKRRFFVDSKHSVKKIYLRENTLTIIVFEVFFVQCWKLLILTSVLRETCSINTLTIVL